MQVREPPKMQRVLLGQGSITKEESETLRPQAAFSLGDGKREMDGLRKREMDGLQCPLPSPTIFP